MNIAVRAHIFDAQFEIIGTSVYKIERILGYGLYDLKLIRQSCELEPDGTVIWNSSKTRKISWTPQQGIREVHPSFSGWKTPSNTPTHPSGA